MIRSVRPDDGAEAPPGSPAPRSSPDDLSAGERASLQALRILVLEDSDEE